MPLAFTVANEIWLAGEKYESGEHEIANPSRELMLHAGSAHAAGEVTVTDGLDVGHVQSQEDAEAALVVAMGDWVPPTFGADGVAVPGYWTGPWHEGNVAQYEIEQALKAEIAAAAEAEGATE